MTRWLWVLAIVAACGKKTKPADVAALADLEAKLAAYEGCLTGNQAGDFTSALVLTLDAVRPSLKCAETTRTPLVAALRSLADHVAVKSSYVEPVLVFNDLDEADKICSDLVSLGDAATALAKKIDGSTVAVPKCELDKLTVAPIRLPAQFEDRRPELRVEDGALIAFAYAKYPDLGDRGVLARTADGSSWEVRETPGHLHEWTWPASGPVGITWQDKHQRTILVDDGKNGWKPAAKTPIDGVYSIWSTGPQITVVGFEKGADDTMVVRRSLDHGATVGPPIALLGGKDMLVRARVRPDGTVVAIGGSTKTAELEAVRLASGAKTASRTADLIWSDTGSSDNNAVICVAGDVYWGMHRRHLVMSSDAGQSWHEITDLGGELGFSHLECSATRLLVWSRSAKDYEAHELRSCTDKGCAAPIAIAGTASMVGFELEPSPQLLISRTPDKPFGVEVSKIEPTGLTRTRVMIVKGEGVIREGGAFVILHSVRDL